MDEDLAPMPGTLPTSGISYVCVAALDLAQLWNFLCIESIHTIGPELASLLWTLTNFCKK